MKLPIYQIDAFAENPFEGNPAAVCPLEEWLPDEVLLSIAEENNLSETAFFVATESGFHIRWFSPVTEVNLCGHATLATAYVLFHCLDYEQDAINFESISGILSVSKKDAFLSLDFPAQPPVSCEIPKEIVSALGVNPIECLIADDYIVVLDCESEVLAVVPDFDMLKGLDLRAVVITSKSTHYDFVSRCFVPKYGINEDPVTGSTHTELVPYWSEKLGKTKLHTRQVSKRGGELYCELSGDRVKISGKAVKYLQGEIEISELR